MRKIDMERKTVRLAQRVLLVLIPHDLLKFYLSQDERCNDGNSDPCYPH